MSNDHDDAYEICPCGQFTHVHEAACIHCGATKPWARGSWPAGEVRVRDYIAEHMPRCYATTEGMARRTAFQEVMEVLDAPPPSARAPQVER